MTIHLKNIFIRGAFGLEGLLNQLVNIRRCTIRGNSAHSWKSMCIVTQPLFEFLQRQKMAEIHLLYIMEFPRPEAAFLLSSSAKRLSFYDVTVDPENTDILHPPSSSWNGKSVLLSYGSEKLLNLLISPEFTPHVANIQKLGLSPFEDEKHNAVFTSATMLEHIRFNCRLKSIILPLPPHPTLRSIELVLNYGQDSCLVQSLTTLLAPTSAPLEEISVSFAGVHDPAFPPIKQQTLAALKALLSGENVISSVGTTTLPLIRLRIDLKLNPRSVSDFTTAVQEVLASLHAEGKLVIERYSDTGETQRDGEWSIY
ncbi:hypothetical protein C8R43DRAFT_638955 [Mycena crocata]|nr:hypothetical protein C8R43DRAFT_638955 [Mycena crocata]